MKIKKVTLQGFKSFSTKQTFTFPDKSGFYFLTGDNKAEPTLGANGAGKSTLWDSISFCLYNKTIKKFKAGNVRTWDSRVPCEVSVLIEVRGIEYEIFRTWNPNALLWSVDGGESKVVTQEELENIINIDFDSFLHAYVIGQEKETFFSLKPEEKLKILSAVLELDNWNTYSASASERSVELKELIEQLDLQYSNLEGQKFQLESQDYSDLILKWEEDRKESVKEYQVDIDTCKNNLTLIEKDIVVIEEFLKKKEKSKKALDADFKGLKKEETEIITDRNNVQNELTEIRISIQNIRKQSKKIEVLGAECPTCLQKIDESHVQQHLESFDTEISKAEKVQKRRQTLKDEIEMDLDDLYSELEGIEQNKTSIEKDIRQKERSLDGLQSEMKSINRDISRYEQALKNYETKENPYKEKQLKVKSQIVSIDSSLKKIGKERSDLIVERDSSVYWVKGFKRVRLFLIKEALVQLEMEVNNSLYQLGLKEWKITFEVDKENKKGDVQKGFFVLIHSPHNKEPVPWGVWSGGESKRLELAGQIGLMNLILTRKGIESNIEVWDEPTQYLSEKGIEDLLEHFKYRSVHTGKQLWLVDHRTLSFGEFDGVVKVVKTNEGSHLETSSNFP